MISLLTLAGLVLVLGGLGYIEDAPMTLAHTLIGAGVSLMGIGLWIVAMLWHHMHEHYNDI
jgi:hypothetical protein